MESDWTQTQTVLNERGILGSTYNGDFIEMHSILNEAEMDLFTHEVHLAGRRKPKHAEMLTIAIYIILIVCFQ